MIDIVPTGFITESPELQRVEARLRKVAPSDSPVLIQGEPGTGKELAARTVHGLSPRSEAPFVAVRCGEIPVTEVAPRLFGHTAGALPGADAARVGAIEDADGGTLFLDEVDELPLDAQNRLRELLTRGVIRPLGSVAPRSVNVRVIACTHGKLIDAVRRGAFRLELYYELAVGMVRLPPLRERPRDLDRLTDHFLAELAESEGPAPELAPSARALLHAQPWHGNVRELLNVLQRVVLWSDGPSIQRRDVEEALDDARGPYASDVLHRPLGESFRIDEILGEVESHYIDLALRQSGGNKARAAQLLGLNNSTTLTNRMSKHGVRAPVT